MEAPLSASDIEADFGLRSTRLPLETRPETYRGRPYLVNIRDDAVPKYEKLLLVVLPRAPPEYLVVPFSDDSPEKLESMLQSSKLPTFWLAIQSLTHVSERDPRSGVARRSRLQISKDYLRQTAQTFGDILELLENIGRVDDRWTLARPDRRQMTVDLELPDQSLSIVERLIQALPKFRPRRLTEAEKAEVVAEIPPIPCADRYASEMHHRQVIQHLLAQLDDVELSPLQLKKYKRRIFRLYVGALIQPYEKVGLRTTAAICQPVMQSTLNSRHKFGASTGMGATIEQFQQVLLNENIGDPTMSIFFENRRITEDEIWAIKYDFEELRIEDVKLRHNVIPAGISPDATGQVLGRPEVWWEPYLLLHRKSLRAGSEPIMLVLVMDFRLDILFDHQLTLADIVARIEQQMPTSVTAVASPTLLDPATKQVSGQIVLFPNSAAAVEEVRALGLEMRGSNPQEVATLIQSAFLGISVVNRVKQIAISGIAGIREISPQYYELISNKTTLIIGEKQVSPGLWELQFDKYLLRRFGLILQDYAYLFSRPEFGATAVQLEPFQYGRYPDSLQVAWPGTGSFKAHVEGLLNREAEALKAKRNEIRTNTRNPYYQHPLTPLLQANRVYYMQTSGSNLREALAFPGVDGNFSYTNNPKEMMAIFGIEIALATITKVLLDVMESTGMKIDLVHILTVAEYQCNQGIVLGLNYHGLDRRQKETFSNAMTQKALMTIARAAAMGKRDPAKSDSTAILIGTLGDFGTARVRVEPGGLAMTMQPQTVQELEATEPIERRPGAAASMAAVSLGLTVPGPEGSTLPTPSTVVPAPAPVLPPEIVAERAPLVDPSQAIPRLEENYQVTPGYTARTAARTTIPVKADVAPVQVRQEVIENPIPQFRYLNLRLPEILQRLLGAEIEAPAPAVAPTIAPIIPPQPTAPKAKPLASFAGILARKK